MRIDRKVAYILEISDFVEGWACWYQLHFQWGEKLSRRVSQETRLQAAAQLLNLAAVMDNQPPLKRLKRGNSARHSETSSRTPSRKASPVSVSRCTEIRTSISATASPAVRYKSLHVMLQNMSVHVQVALQEDPVDSVHPVEDKRPGHPTDSKVNAASCRTEGSTYEIPETSRRRMEGWLCLQSNAVWDHLYSICNWCAQIFILNTHKQCQIDPVKSPWKIDLTHSRIHSPSRILQYDH